jgi:hypothetical protein
MESELKSNLLILSSKDQCPPRTAIELQFPIITCQLWCKEVNGVPNSRISFCVAGKTNIILSIIATALLIQ